jgi:hypothetical protein
MEGLGGGKRVQMDRPSERAQPSSRVFRLPQAPATREVCGLTSKRLPVTLIPAPSNERAGRW